MVSGRPRERNRDQFRESDRSQFVGYLRQRSADACRSCRADLSLPDRDGRGDAGDDYKMTPRLLYIRNAIAAIASLPIMTGAAFAHDLLLAVPCDGAQRRALANSGHP